MIDNDNLHKVMDEVQDLKLKGSSLGSVLMGRARSFRYLARRNLRPVISWIAASSTSSDVYAPQQTARGRVGHGWSATIAGEYLQVSATTNGTSWNIKEITVGLTILRDGQIRTERVLDRSRRQRLQRRQRRRPAGGEPLRVGAPGRRDGRHRPVGDPQFVVDDPGFYARVDLADDELEIVIEAESFEFHSSAQSARPGLRRYNGLTVRGWLVLRFTWKQVMFEPELVSATLAAAVALRRRAGRSTGTRRRLAASGG